MTRQKEEPGVSEASEGMLRGGGGRGHRLLTGRQHPPHKQGADYASVVAVAPVQVRGCGVESAVDGREGLVLFALATVLTLT